jgi:ABC-type Zn uptake system ZnuABC Zn-binding protein ZnuA
VLHRSPVPAPGPRQPKLFDGCWRWLIGWSAAAALVGGCTRPTAPQVIAGDGVLCDLTRRLAAESLTVACLLGPSDDPHQLQLSPRQSAELRQARLLLINGYGLTPALERLPAAVPVAELAVPDSPRLDAGADLHTGEQALEHHDGHATNHDPHVWHDPRQAAAMVALVSERLQRLDPAAAAVIRGRQERMQQALLALDRWNHRQFASLPASPGHRSLATGHRAFASLCRAYGLQELALIDGGSSADVLRPQALAAAVARLRREQVPALFTESWPASRAISRISQLSGVPLVPQPLRADGLAPATASADADGDLMTTLTTNTCLVVSHLGGRCDRSGQRALIRQWQEIQPQASQRRSKLL